MLIPPWSLDENGPNPVTPLINQVQLVLSSVADLKVVEGLYLGQVRIFSCIKVLIHLLFRKKIQKQSIRLNVGILAALI